MSNTDEMHVHEWPQEVIDGLAARINHGRGCPGPEPTRTVGSQGDDMVRCRPCGRFVIVAEYIKPKPARAKPRPATRYVCREHGEPVTWKGTGCNRCADARARARQRRQDDE